MPYNPDIHGPVRIVGPGFRERVYSVVRSVPAGWVTTYGDVGGVLGSPTVARQVGFALAALSDADSAAGAGVPWHRVVNSKGAVSYRGDDGRGAEQQRLLESEGISFSSPGVIAAFASKRFVYDAPDPRFATQRPPKADDVKTTSSKTARRKP